MNFSASRRENQAVRISLPEKGRDPLMKRIATIAVFVVLFVPPAYSQGKSSTTVAEIVARVTSAYSSCRTYSDEGEVKLHSESSMNLFGFGGVYASDPRRRNQSFRTAFVRPAKFRFEVWSDGSRGDWQRLIAWKEGDTEKSWWWQSQHESPLGRSLRDFSPLSHDVAKTVPALLFPDLFPAGNLLNAIEGLKLDGRDKFDGRETFRLAGKYEGDAFKVWIDSETFLIVKTLRRQKFYSADLDTITTYKPQINADIAADLLAFNTPAVHELLQAAVASDPNVLPMVVPPQLDAKPDAAKLSLAPKKVEAPKKEKEKKKKGDKAAAPANNVLPADEDDVVRVDTNLVALDVLAVDKEGRFINGLTGKDFVVKEDGELQTVATFALGDDPNRARTIILIIDYSGSQLPFIRNSVEAAKTLVDQLNPKDRMAIVTDDISLLVDFTQDKVELKKRLDSLWKGVSSEHRLGMSAQYSALMATIDRLATEADVHPIIIFQTDGDELPILRPVSKYPPPYPMAVSNTVRKFSILDIFSAGLRSKATIYSVVPGIRLIGFSPAEQAQRAKHAWEVWDSALEKFRPDINKRLRAANEKRSDEDWQKTVATGVWTQTALLTLARITGGWADFLEKEDQAAAIYARILNDINRRYIVGYQPINKAHDGKLRRVSVTVRDHPEYVVFGRDSYYAPAP
jgi:VWFA-related protein